MKLSNTLLGIINAIAALIAVAMIGAGIWLATKHSTECARLLQWPAVGLGAFILVVSLAGLLGSFCRMRWLLCVYMVVIFVLILAIAAFTIFAFVVTNKGAGHAVSGKGYEEYRLGDYSTWLRRNVLDKAGNWNKIKSCLVDAKVCKSLETDITSASSFYKQNLSPIQSGCCKPPTACNFTYVSATMWKNATKLNADSDCKKWSNDSSEFCFNCDSCKAGVLQDAKKNWKNVAIFNGAVLVLLILVFTLACCAITNNRTEPFVDPYVKA